MMMMSIFWEWAVQCGALSDESNGSALNNLSECRVKMAGKWINWIKDRQQLEYIVLLTWFIWFHMHILVCIHAYAECVYLKYKNLCYNIIFFKSLWLKYNIYWMCYYFWCILLLTQRMKNFHPLMTKFDACFGDENDNFSRKLEFDKHFFGYWTLKLTFDMLYWNCKLNFLIAGNWNFKHSLSVMNLCIENF